MSMSKKEAERRHASRRLYERYGIKLTKSLRKELLRQILNREGRLLRKESSRIIICTVYLPYGIEVPVVYDAKRREIVTFLYPDSIEIELEKAS